MKLYKHALAIALLLAAAFVFACGDDDDDGGDDPSGSATAAATSEAASATGGGRIGYPLSLTDDNGIEVTLEAQPEAIVALAPSFVEVLYAVGAGDAIVAADENTDAPPEAADIPKISGFSPSVEGIASYNPDLVLIFYDPGGLQDALTQLEIPTMFLATPATVDAVYEQIVTIGTAVGHFDEATEVVGDMEADIATVVEGIGDGAGPSVFWELDPQLFTIGPGSFPDEVLTLLKATNVAASTGEPYPQMSAEAVIAANPEVVILADGDFGESPETVAARPGWDVVAAVSTDRVYPVSGGLLNHASPRLVDDVQELSGLLYP